MRGKVAKQLNKLAKLLELTPAEYRKLKKDFQKTPNHSLTELKERVKRVERTADAID